MSAALSPNARLRYDVVRRLVASAAGARTFLEVGCGQGALAVLLAQRFDYVGFEPDEASFRVAQDRLRLVGRGRVVNAALPEVPEREYDLVGAFEVLEHLADDAQALAAWTRWLRPGGRLLLSVPAHPRRYGPADEYVGHYRRYSREGLEALLLRAGLSEPRIVAYGFPLGYVLEWGRNLILGRRLRRTSDSVTARTAASGRRLQPGPGLAPLLWMGTLPFRYLQRPFAGTDIGTGFVACARLPGPV